MLEFNIQPREGGWFVFPPAIGDDCSIYQPLEIPSTIIPNRDVCTIMVADCEVSFSYEMHGIHVVFETGTISFEEAHTIVISISERLTICTGQPSVVY